MNKVTWLIFVGLLFASGCTTNLSERVSELEERMKSAENRIEFCEIRIDTCESKTYEIGKGGDIVEPRYDELSTGKDERPTDDFERNMTAEEIQTALKNANFYNGSIDGKIGPNTMKAIIEFQKANGLKADGIVGAKTKALLVKYLSQNTY